MPKQHFILITGDLFTGFSIIGPFEQATDAVDYGEDNFDEDMYWVAEMISPKEIVLN